MVEEELTLSKAAEIADYSASYLRKFCQNGALPARQIEIGDRVIWLVKRDTLLAWKTTHKASLVKPKLEQS
jgi:hypothetical protein